MKKALLLIAALAAFAACTRTVEVPVEVEVEVEKIVDILTLNAAQLQVPNKAVEQPISFTVEGDWTISSDADWITFDKTSGSKGSNNVTMKIAKSELYSTRTGRVTLSSTHGTTTKNTVFTVIQSENEVFNSTVSLTISPDEQDITVAYNSNLTPDVKVVEGDWLTMVSTKADPSDGTIVVHAAANEGEEARTGSFTVAAGGNIQTYNVYQASVEAPIVATGLYLSNVQDMYDAETWSFKQFEQFAVQFPTEDGDLTLVLNVASPVDDATRIPSGEYTIDEAGVYAPGTFSVKPANPAIRYYTTVANGDNEMEVVEGVINVMEVMGIYNIVASLVDVDGATHVYTYQGEIEITDSSFGARVYTDASYSNLKGQFNTYYTTKAFETNVFLHLNKPCPGNEDWVYGLGFNIFTQESDGKIPTGQFTYAVPEQNTELGYANGITVAQPGTFNIQSIYAFAQNPDNSASCTLKEGTTPTLEIIKQDDGRYTVKVNAVVVISEYYFDENWAQVPVGEKEVTLNTTLTDIYCDGLEDSGQVPCPDGDHDFSMVWNSANYMPYWFGDAYNTGCHVMRLGWNYVDMQYSVQIALNVKDDDWQFVQNFSRFCTTPFKLGTFTFSWTPGENTMLPVKTYHHVLNKYTGHTYAIVSGSVTMTSEKITYDLTVKDGDQTYHIGGGHPATLYYIRNNSTSAAPGLDTAE